MSDAVGTIEQLAGELARVFAPLARPVEGNAAYAWLEWLGLRPSDAVPGASDLAAALGATVASAADVEQFSERLADAIRQDDGAAVATASAALLQHLAMLVQAAHDAAGALQALSARPGLTPEQRADLAAFASVFVARLFNRLFVEYLEARFPHLALVLIATGGIEIVWEDEAGPGSLDSAYVRKTFHVGRMAKLFTDPAGLLREVYQWGEPDFDGLALLTALQTMLREKFDIPAEILQPPGAPAILEAFGFSAEVNPDLDPPGLDVSLRMPASVDLTDTIDTGDWLVTLDAHAALAADLAVTLRPVLDLQLDVPSGACDVRLSARFARALTAPPFLLLGEAGGSRLEVRSANAGAVLDLHLDTTSSRLAVDPQLTAALRGGLVISTEDGDGFLTAVLSGVTLESGFDVDLGWSPSRGARFTGSAGLEASWPLHAALGPVTLDSLTLGFSTDGNRIRAQASFGAGLALGPFAVRIDRAGLEALVSFPEAGGNLGVADLDFHFKPPDGLGLAIDTPVVVGGGYLRFDPQKEEYSGVLQLEVAETIAVKAIALLTTRMPDGSKGFSLVVIMSAEGFAPIQLGFGFTLTGIGGLLAVNRTVMVDVLRSGLKNGTLGSILFPADPVRNAPQIVSDLRAVFPPVKDRHVFGPMAIIAWGTPTILTLQLGLFLELPDPVRLFIAGRLQAMLPDAGHALVQVRMDAIGLVDFNRADVSLDATLYDSRILAFTLTGDMALRANWGTQSTFVLAIGGFHPRFPAPAGFPQLDRLALSLSDGDDLQLRCEAYLALTSNTVQFGARLDLHAAGGGFSFDGSLAFDALFQLTPFAFVVDIGAALALRYHGHLLVGVFFNGTLSGPTPWHVEGKATIKILFLKVSVHFDHQFGVEEPPPLPPPVDVLSRIVDALRDRRNWSAALPRSEPPVVSIRETPTTSASLLVHPLATLTVRERVAPLNRLITRLGNAPLMGGPTTVTVDVAGIGTAPVPMAATPVREPFALAQYQDMTDDEKLARPSFEPLDAGLQFGLEAVAYEHEATLDTPIDYETLLIDPTRPPQPVAAPYVLPQGVLDAVVSLGAAGQAAFRGRGLNRYRDRQLVA